MRVLAGILFTALLIMGTGCSKAPAGSALGMDGFEREVHKADQLVLVDFWAPWCGPCRYMGPILEEYAREHADRLKLVKVNTDIDQDVAVAHNVEVLPTLMLFRGDKVIDVHLGAMEKTSLEQWVQPHLN